MATDAVVSCYKYETNGKEALLYGTEMVGRKTGIGCMHVPEMTHQNPMAPTDATPILDESSSMTCSVTEIDSALL